MPKKFKRLWYNGNLWDVVQVIQPTDNDFFLLCRREMKEAVHYNGNTPVDMILLDTGNDAFYPDTKEVRRLVELQKEKEQELNDVKRALESHWFNAVNPERWG